MSGKLTTNSKSPNPSSAEDPEVLEYFTPYEASLSCIATGLKKARLSTINLLINSILGGVVFSTGGLLITQLHGLIFIDPIQRDLNIGLLLFLKGSILPIALCLVVILGLELFNSNTMFFTICMCGGTLGIKSTLRNWILVTLGNLLGSLFVCYVIMYLSLGRNDKYVILGAQYTMNSELSKTELQNFIKGFIGNILICIGIYTNLMCKPIHVKFLMIFISIFTFSVLGYNHVITELFIVPFGILNMGKYDVTIVKEWISNSSTLLWYNDLSSGEINKAQRHAIVMFIWKMFIPTYLGNAIGGIIFAIVIPYYLHYYTVEKDRELVGLPTHNYKDTRPEINLESIVTPQSE